MTRKGQWQSKDPLIWIVPQLRGITQWVCETCLRVSLSIFMPLHAGCQGRSSTVCTWFCRRTATAKIHYPLPSMVSTELKWFIPPGASVQYAANIFSRWKMVRFRKVTTWFCLCFLMLQKGLSQDLICWRLSKICNTVLGAGNLGYLVHQYESLYCAEQGHFPFCLCLLFI